MFLSVRERHTRHWESRAEVIPKMGEGEGRGVHIYPTPATTPYTDPLISCTQTSGEMPQGTHYVPGAVLATEDGTANQRDNTLPSGADSLLGEDGPKEISKHSTSCVRF